jgi:hypothetical protein
MALTDDEVLSINTARRGTKPLVFNADLDQEVAISQDTEDALILTSNTVKVKAVQYLKLLLDSNQGSTDSDDLIIEFATQQITNEVELENEINTILGSLNSFREDLVQGNRDEVFTAGFSPVIQLINKSLGKIQVEADSNRFHAKLAEFAESRFTGRLSDLDRRSLRSWIRVFLAYP